MWLTIGLLALAGGVVWLLRAPRRRPPAGVGSRDADVLADAEAEVRDLDALTTPEEASDTLPDWGPGVPRP